MATRRKVEASESGSRERRRNRAHGMELVPSRRGQPKPSMLAGIAATVKGRAAAMQEDAKGKVGSYYVQIYIVKRFNGFCL